MCLVICSKTLNYFPTSTNDLNLKPKSVTPILSIQRHRVSNVIATATNPSKSVSPIGISVSPRWDCNLSVYVHYQNRSHRVWAIGTTEITMQTLWLTYYQNRSHRVCVIGLTEITLCPNPNEIDLAELTCRSHRKSQRSHFELNQSDRVLLFGPTDFGDLCVTVRFCVKSIYIPLHPLFIRGESHNNMPTLPTYFFWERTTYTCFEVKIFHSNHINFDL